MKRHDACGIIPYLVCVLCVQFIAHNQRCIADPDTSEKERERLKRTVKRRECTIRYRKQTIVEVDQELSKLGEQIGKSITIVVEFLWIFYGAFKNDSDLYNYVKLSVWPDFLLMTTCFGLLNHI